MSETVPKQVEVKIESENSKGSLPGYLTYADGQKQGIIVIQEWWGVNAQIKNLAVEWYASQGFATIIPDLYRGQVATDHEHAGHLMNGLDWPGAIKDIAGAAKFLKSKGITKIGVVGYCMGGALSMASNVLINDIDASSVFYGLPQAQLADIAKARAPVQLHFGDKDEYKGFSDPAAVDAAEAKLKTAGVPYERYVYEGAGHAFANDARKDEKGVYHEEYAKLARERTVAFFKKYLAA